MSNRTIILVGAAGLLVVLPFLGGCSTDSDFWDRSPCVGGVRQDYCPSPTQAPRQCCPTQPRCAPTPAPRSVQRQAQPYAPRQAQPAPAQPPAQGFPAPAPQGGGPASAEEMDVLRRVNAIRAQHSLRPLRFNDRLWVAARDHSLEQQRHGYMGHGSPDPNRARLSQRIAQAGYQGSAYAEVVAWGYRNTASVVEGWMNSSGHRAILLDGELTEAGFSRAGEYWTGNFGVPLRYQPRARPQVTPRRPAAAPAPRATPRRTVQRPPATTRQAPPRRAPAPAPRRRPQQIFDVNPRGGG